MKTKLTLLIIIFSMIFLLSSKALSATQVKISVVRDQNGVLKITQSSIEISWQSVLGAAFYDVSITDNNGYSYIAPDVIQNSFVFTNLKSSTMYKIEVKAKNTNGDVFDSNYIYVITEFSMVASPLEDFPTPVGSGGDKPKIEIRWTEIKNNFNDDINFNGYNLFVSRKQDRSDANQYMISKDDLKLYKYTVSGSNTIQVPLVLDSVYQQAYNQNEQISFILYDSYDGFTTKELNAGTMYYLYMEPNIVKSNNVNIYYKPLTNVNCPTLMKINASKVAEITNTKGDLGALVRVQWSPVDTGSYKVNEIQYRAYFATNENDLPIDNLPPQNIFAMTTYYQNEAFVPWLSMNVDYYYFRVEAIFADGEMRIPSQIIKVSVKSLADVPSVINKFNVATISSTKLRISFEKPLQDDSDLVYQIWYSDTYKDYYDTNGDPTVYNLIYNDPDLSDKSFGGLNGLDFTFDASTNIYSYDIDNLKPNSVYYFKIRVVNEETKRRSDFSVVAVATTKSENKIIVPTVDYAYVFSDVYSITANILPVNKENFITSGVNATIFYSVYISENSADLNNFKLALTVDEDTLNQNNSNILLDNSNILNGLNIKSNTVYYIRFKVIAKIDDKEYISEFSKAFFIATKIPKTGDVNISRPNIPNNFIIDDADGAVTQTSVVLRWDILPNQKYTILRTLRPIDDSKRSISETIDYIVNTLKKKVDIYTQNSNGNIVFVESKIPQGITNPELFGVLFKNVTPKFADANLAPNTVYYYSIKAIEGEGESLWGTIAVTTSLSDKPENLIVYTRGTDGHSITIQWQGNPNLGFQIFVKKEEQDDFSLIYQGNLPSLTTISTSKALFSYTILNLKSNSLYYIKVRSFHIPTGKVSIPSDVLAARTLFNQLDFDNEQKEALQKEQDQNKITKLLKQVLVVWENSTQIYNLYVNDTNALDYIERSGNDDFIIDFTQATYKVPKAKVQFGFRVVQKLIEYKRNIIVKFYDSNFIIPPNALCTDVIENNANTNKIDKGYVNIYIEVGFSDYKVPLSGYQLDSKPVYLKVWANYYLSGDKIFSDFKNPITVILYYSTPVRDLKQIRVPIIFNNWKKVEVYKNIQGSMYVSFDVTKPGDFGVMKSSTNEIDFSPYKDEVIQICNKYNMQDYLSKVYAYTDFITLKDVTDRVFNFSTEKYINNINNLTAQDIIFILAKVFEEKKGIKSDTMSFSKIIKNENLNPKYYFEVNAMLNIGVIDEGFEPDKKVLVDKFLHYIYTLDMLINK
ncbi:hypothetical protein ACAG39_05725, partial [Caldicellulosiruptoraceae bacterium PP1]